MLVAKIINNFLSTTLGVRIVKSTNRLNSSTEKKIFSNRHLKESKNGYYFLDPMPTEEDLDKYYSSIYWDKRLGKNDSLNTRDLVHWHLLKKHIPNFFNDNKKLVLNFGAGHGGISNLFWFDGFDVVNIESSKMENTYSKRWVCKKSTYEVQSNSVDFVYGSHSLEHVQNIEQFKQEIKRILKVDGYVFWEVPNAEYPLNGAMLNKIDVPHTYYFKKRFFEHFFDKIIFNKSFNQTKNLGIVDEWQRFEDAEGEVIRVIGMFNSSE